MDPALLPHDWQIFERGSSNDDDGIMADKARECEDDGVTKDCGPLLESSPSVNMID